ncbi:quinone oxidoreductase-like protein 2 isoform X2 [Rhinatrema bivittatum]|uniref:quinone oxidoreductase-like protein 2 isoform X2 n=1 Tax=Rhinatrema bivittatum TaxID=194408 RepID=UPI00112664BB|nr:quinone oxidoreductase-like protein 2 isoform X2 [Rhinatrema bivittatum]
MYALNSRAYMKRTSKYSLMRKAPTGRAVLGVEASVSSACSVPCRTYRAAVCTELKRPLIIKDVSSMDLKPSQVRVAVQYCGMNFADILACEGRYQEKKRPPFTPGLEFSGLVVETGANVTTLQKGDRVIGIHVMESMAEECVVEEKMLWKIPEPISYEQAAALPVCYGTAFLALVHRARVQDGETVLVTGATGALGHAMVDVASKVLKVKVIAAAGNDKECSWALQRGAQCSVNYGKVSLKEELKKLTGNQGVDVVIDAIGGDIFKEAFSSLKWEGRIVVVGFAGGNIPSIPANLLLLRNVSAHGVYWAQNRKHNFPLFSWSISSVLKHCQEGKIQPHIGAMFKLEEVNKAFELVKQRSSMGKIILSMK